MKNLILSLAFFGLGTGAWAQEKKDETRTVATEGDTVEIEMIPLKIALPPVTPDGMAPFSLCVQNEDEYQNLPFMDKAHLEWLRNGKNVVGHVDYKLPDFDFAKNRLFVFADAGPEAMRNRLYFVKSKGEYVWEFRRYYYKTFKKLEYRIYSGFYSVPLSVDCGKLKVEHKTLFEKP